jgi:hypothetical protein
MEWLNFTYGVAQSIVGSILFSGLCIAIAWAKTKNTIPDEATLRSFVADLLSQATSSARRADIHAYILFRCNEIEANLTRRLLSLFAMAAGFIVATIVIAFSWRGIDFESAPWRQWVLITPYVGIFAMLLFQFFSNYKYARFGRTWQAKACEILYERAFRHVVKGSSQ